MHPSQKQAIQTHTLVLEMCKRLVVGGTLGFAGCSEQNGRKNTYNCKENNHTFMSANGHTDNAFNFFVEDVGLENNSNQSMIRNVYFIQPCKCTEQDNEIVSGAHRTRIYTMFSFGAGYISLTLQSTISDTIVATDCRGVSKHTTCSPHIIACELSRWLTRLIVINVIGSKSFQPDIQKPHQMENSARVPFEGHRVTSSQMCKVC
jgi:hypothetical protein